MKSEVRTVEVPLGRLAAFNAKVAALAKRAARLDVPPITVTEIGRKTEKHAIVVSDGLVEWGVGSREVEVVTFSVEGETPTMPGGWTLLGVLEFTEGGVLVTGDDERLAQFRDEPATCEHCKTARRRNKVVVAVDETGSLMRVGTTCLKDAFGFWGTPEQALYAIEAEGDLDDDWFGADHGPWHYSTRETVAESVALVERWGFAKTSSEHSTVAALNVLRTRPSKNDGEWEIAIRSTVVTDEHFAKADAIIAWGSTLDGSDYEHNLGVALRCASETKIGLLASAPTAYERAMGRLAERAERQAERDAEIKVEAPEGRQTITGTIVSLKDHASDFGISVKMTVKVETPAGVYLVWSTLPSILEATNVWNPETRQGELRPGPSVGDTLTFTATLTRSDRDPSFAFGKRPTVKDGALVRKVAA